MYLPCGQPREEINRTKESLSVKIIPKFFNCRPIYLEDSVREAGYKIVKTEEFILAGLMPERIVVAEPEKGGLR